MHRNREHDVSTYKELLNLVDDKKLGKGADVSNKASKKKAKKKKKEEYSE